MVVVALVEERFVTFATSLNNRVEVAFVDVELTTVNPPVTFNVLFTSSQFKAAAS